MKSIAPFILGSIFFLSCSQPYQRAISHEERTKHLNIFDDLDSTMVEGTIKPFDYKWNTEGNLIDLVRKKYKPPKMYSNYPYPFLRQLIYL